MEDVIVLRVGPGGEGGGVERHGGQESDVGVHCE